MGKFLYLCSEKSTTLMKTRVIILLAALFGWCVLTEGQESYTYVERDSALMLDIYAPIDSANGYTVVHVFGGGFIHGSRTKAWDRDYCRQLASRGYRAVAIDYRLGLKGAKKVGIGNIEVLENAFYMAAADCCAAIRYLVAHARELGIEPDKIILEGSSAGAITVLMTDYGRCNGLEYTRELPEGWRPAGVIAYSGAIYSKEGKLKWAQAPAPTLLFHGEKDRIVTYKQIVVGKRGLYGGSKIAKRLAKSQYPYRIYRFPELGHEVSVGGPMTLEELDLFVSQHLRSGRVIEEDITMRDAAIRPSKFTYMRLKDLYK